MEASSSSSVHLTCEVCEEVFPSRNKLFRHVLNYHRDEDDQVAPARSGSGNEDDQCRMIDEVSVVYSDPWLLIVDKPQGMCTQRVRNISECANSLQSSDALLLSKEEKSRYPDSSHHMHRKAKPVHRLDKETGGLVLCCKSYEVESALKFMFENRKVQKRYMAIVCGRLVPAEGEIALNVQKKTALTKYKVLDYSRSATYGGWITTVSLSPVSGRKHQLRRHLSSIGHPIVGDEKYNRHPLPSTCAFGTGLNRLYLWAVEMSFDHPFPETHAAIKSKDSALGNGTELPQRVCAAIPEPSVFNELRTHENLKWDRRNN